MKDILFEYRITKRKWTKINEQRIELRNHRAYTRERIVPSKRCRNLDADQEAENERCMDMIYGESHFNFIKIHVLSNFSDQIRQFGNIRMYLTETAELAHKTQIKDAWWQSNKNGDSH